jgi:hypothetical protein
MDPIGMKEETNDLNVKKSLKKKLHATEREDVSLIES